MVSAARAAGSATRGAVELEFVPAPSAREPRPTGVSRDQAVAARWYELAAAQGSAMAQHRLALQVPHAADRLAAIERSAEGQPASAPR